MKFKSRIELAEHIKELETDGYLVAEWLPHRQEYGKPMRSTKVYKVNFGAIQ